MKYYITGATGHLGLNLVNKLIELGKKVKVFVTIDDINVYNLPKEVEICYGDIRTSDDIKNFLCHDKNEENIVVHCAGIVSIASKYDSLTYDINVNGTKNIVDLCIQENMNKMIYISSVHAIKEENLGTIIKETKTFISDDVVGLYAKTKSEATSYVLHACKRGLNGIVIHPSGLIGPNDYGKGHITQLIIDYCTGRLSAAIKGGYDFVDVRDVCDGIISACKNGKKGKCYILSNKYYSIKEILDILSNIINHKKIKIYLPLWFINLVVPFAEYYYKILKQPPLFTKYSLYTLQSNSIFSHELATKELNFIPRDITETLNDTVQFLQREQKI